MSVRKPPIPAAVKVANSPIFTVLERLGEGGFGTVHKGRKTIEDQNPNDPLDVAIKFEYSDDEPEEWKFYDALQVVKEIPKVYYKGKCGEYYITIMELLGPSLRTKWFSDVKKNRSEDESKEWLMEKAVECIQILRNIHQLGILHGDVKPGNIVMGKEGTPEEDKVYFVDFGLSDIYRKNNAHAKYDQDLGRFHGTVRYASIHAHLGRIQSRRDDLESLAYTFAYLLNGYAHWSALENRQDEQYQVGRKKMEITPSILMGSRRSPFKHFFDLVIALKFNDEPDYELMKNVFRLKLRNPNRTEKIVTHVDLTQNNFNNRFMLGKDVSQFVAIWTEREHPMEQVFKLNVEERHLKRVIQKVYNEKYVVSNAVYSNGLWNLVCNRFAKSIKQVWFFSDGTDELMPVDLLDRYTVKGYNITAVACTPDMRGLFFMTKGTSGDQRYHVHDEFPYEWICENWNEGYHIIALTCSLDGGKWAVVMATGTGYEDQVIEFDFIYPSEGVNKRWQQGYYVSCAAGNCYGCVLVMSRKAGKKRLLPAIQRSLRTCDLEKAIDQHKERLSKTYVTALCFGRTIC